MTREDHFDAVILPVVVSVLYMLLIEWAAAQWFHQPRGMSGPGLLTLVAVWAWLAERRTRGARMATAHARESVGQAFASTVAPALAIATLLLLPQLLLRRWWQVVLAGALIGLAFRVWRARHSSAPSLGPRPNDR